MFARVNRKRLTPTLPTLLGDRGRWLGNSVLMLIIYKYLERFFLLLLPAARSSDCYFVLFSPGAASLIF